MRQKLLAKPTWDVEIRTSLNRGKLVEKIIRFLVLVMFFSSLVSCVTRQILAIPEATSASQENEFSSPALNVPCIISVSAPENFPGRQKSIVENPFISKVYYYPLKSTLQSSFEKSLYRLFSPPNGQISNVYSVEIALSESSLEVTSTTADFSLCCQITLRAPTDKIISTQTVRVFEKSAFDGKTTPAAVYRAAEQIAETYRKTLETDKRLLASYQPAIQNNIVATPIQRNEKFTANEFPIKAYQYDSKTRNGTVTVDIGDKGFQARLWVVKNIGAICSSKNISLEAGSEVFQGAKYQVLNESIENGQLTITFEAIY